MPKPEQSFGQPVAARVVFVVHCEAEFTLLQETLLLGVQRSADEHTLGDSAVDVEGCDDNTRRIYTK